MIFKVAILFGIILGTFSISIENARAEFSDYFNSVQWITRDGIVSLSIDHKSIPFWKARESFDILKANYGSDIEWQNEDSLYSQYACHVQFAPLKNPWNLEPHRTGTGFWNNLTNLCNPTRYLYYLLESKSKSK